MGSSKWYGRDELEDNETRYEPSFAFSVCIAVLPLDHSEVRAEEAGDANGGCLTTGQLQK